MKLTKQKYSISRETLQSVLYQLDCHRVFMDEENDEYNNEDVIEVHDKLQEELEVVERQGEGGIIPSTTINIPGR